MPRKMTKKESDILSKKIIKGVKDSIAAAINEHKALGHSIVVWSEKENKVVEIPASKIKKRRLKA